MKTKLIPIGLFLTAKLAFSATSAASDLLPDLVEKVSPGAVNISSSRFVKQYVLRGMPEFFGTFGIPEERISKQSSLGTGFVIDNEGYILTNNHVIENADEVVINFLDKRRIEAKIIGRDKQLDLALLQLKASAGGDPRVPNLKPVSMGQSSQVRIGESVFAIGNPFGLQHTVTSGIISAKNRTIGVGPFDNFLQTDCSINFGNSGGPLFNMKGEVIGINTAINAQGQGLGFAIPIDEAKNYLPDLKKFGHINRPWLGVLGENISPAAQYYYQLHAGSGVFIERLDPAGPAAQAGIKPLDVILKMNNQKIEERSDIQRLLAKLKPNSSVEVQIDRFGKKATKQIMLKPAPDSSDMPEGVF